MLIDPLSLAQFGVAGLALGSMIYVVRLLVKTNQTNQALLIEVQNRHAEQLKEMNEKIMHVVEQNTHAINKFSDKLDNLMYIKARKRADSK